MHGASFLSAVWMVRELQDVGGYGESGPGTLGLRVE